MRGSTAWRRDGPETVTYSWDGGTNTLTATRRAARRESVQGGARPTATGAYTVTLLDNVLHAGGPNDEATDATAALTYTVTDADGSSATSTLTITFDDDAPTATSRCDAERCRRRDGHRHAGLRAGADGATVTHIDGTALVFNPADANYSQAIDIGPGLLKVKADGSYSFTADRGDESPCRWRRRRSG